MDRLETLKAAIADNTVPGGSAFGRAAAEVIALTLETSEVDDADVAALLASATSWLIATKPSMTSVRTVATIAHETLGANGSRDAVVQAMRAFVADSEASIASISRHADDVIKPGSTVLFHSFSASLLQVLRHAAASSSDLTVLFTESRPYRESLRVAAALADSDVRLVAYSDASVAIAAARADLAVIGADAIFRDGSFANKTGSLPLALACRHVGAPLYVVSELSKLYPGDPDDVVMEQRPAVEMAEGWELWTSGRLEVVNQFFERVPADLVTAYLTDRGQRRPDELAAVIEPPAMNRDGTS